MIPRMPKFRHTCVPCDACDMDGSDCDVCDGKSRRCECEAAYEAEGDRRYSAWKNGDYDE